MKCTVHFYKVNYDFSPEFAETHHQGKPSENNRLYDWEDELVVKSSVVSYKVVENGAFTLKGEKGGKPFEEIIQNVMRFEFIDENDSITVMACSHSVVKDYGIEEKNGELDVEIFLEELEPLTNPIPGVYIAVQEFPKALI